MDASMATIQTAAMKSNLPGSPAPIRGRVVRLEIRDAVKEQSDWMASPSANTQMAGSPVAYEAMRQTNHAEMMKYVQLKPMNATSYGCWSVSMRWTRKMQPTIIGRSKRTVSV